MERLGLVGRDCAATYGFLASSDVPWSLLHIHQLSKGLQLALSAALSVIAALALPRTVPSPANLRLRLPASPRLHVRLPNSMRRVNTA